MKSKFLIIGGSGFIGRNLCRLLVNKGISVYSFDLCTTKIKIEGVNYIEGNFFDDETLKKIIEDKDVIYHAISTINPGNSNEKYMQGYNLDFIQTVKLCSLLQETKKKLIFLSSGGTVYGIQEKQPIKETALPIPINHYGNLKLCLENTIKTFNVQSNTKNLIARISNPYGPGQDYTKGVGFIDAVLKKTLNNDVIEIWGDGETIRDYIYIDDVCEVLYQLSQYNGEEFVFNVSSNKGISQNQVISILKGFNSNIKIEYKPSRNVDVKKVILDNSKIKSICDCQFIKFQDGIKLYYDYLSKNTEL